MNFFKIITSFLFVAIAKAAAGGLAVSSPILSPAPLVARNVLSSPLLTGEVIAPAFARAAPLVAPAPLLAQATIGYTSSIPQNIPPFASQVSIVNRALSGYVAAPLSSAYFAAPVAVPVLRSPLAYTASPFVSSLPFYRSALAAPVAAPIAARFAAPLAAPIAAPLALSAPAFPLQTQALFQSALAPAPVPVGVATTRLVPTGDAVSETVPQSDEDPSVEAVRSASQESNDAPSDDVSNQNDDSANVENIAPEDQASN